MLNAVIIAGGRGERFWPRSRFHKPKQLLPIAGKETMLKVTVKRIGHIIPPQRIYVITNEELKHETMKQVPEIPERNVIAEPFGRNTAAAVGLGAVYAGESDSSAVMAVLPADHLISEEKKFISCVSAAVKSAEEKESLVVFGIKPDRPEAGYGHIKAGRKIGCENGIDIYRADAFIEKPDPVKAKEFFESGEYYWNSGMFVWKCSAIMEAFKIHMNELFTGLQKIKNSDSSGRRQAIKDVYDRIDSISIDYGVMEKADNRVMVRGDFKWDDVGSWAAMERIWQKDVNGNAVQGAFVGIDTRDSVIAGGKKLVAAIGISGMIVVATDDAVLVCPKERAQEVKKLIKELQKNKLDKYIE